MTAAKFYRLSKSVGFFFCLVDRKLRLMNDRRAQQQQQSSFFFPNRLQNCWGEENDQVSREEHEGVDRQATEGPVWHSKTDLGDNNHLDQTRKKRVLKTCSGVVEKRGKWHTNCPSFFPSLGARWGLEEGLQLWSTDDFHNQIWFGFFSLQHRRQSTSM